MKQIIISTFLSVFLFSCKRETNMTQTTVENTVTSGSWSISFYEDSGENETSVFQGWIFYFGEDGILRCENQVQMMIQLTISISILFFMGIPFQS